MNNFSNILIVYLMMFCISCATKNVINNQIDSNQGFNNINLDKNYPFLKMRRTPCFGKCPYYEVIIFSNGDISYEGFKFVEKIGKFKSSINIKKLAYIKEKIKEVDFFSFDSIYDAGVSDLPSIIIEVNINNKKHRVKGRYKMPQQFKYFSNFIDEIFNEVDSWDKIIDQ